MKRCSCGSEMKQQQSAYESLTKWYCENCRRTVLTTAKGENERTRMQHGLGMKRTKWF